MSSNKKSLVVWFLFLRSINSKRKIKETVGPLVNAAENLVTKDMEKFEVLSDFFTSGFPGT